MRDLKRSKSKIYPLAKTDKYTEKIKVGGLLNYMPVIL